MSLAGPTKVKASILFTEGSPEVENKELLFDFVVTLISCLIPSSVNYVSVYYQKFEDEKIISQIVRISEDCDQDCDQNGDRVSKNNENSHICII